MRLFFFNSNKMRNKQPLDFITENPVAAIALLVASLKFINQKNNKMETKLNYQKMVLFAASLFFGIIAFAFSGITIIEALMQQSFTNSEKKVYYSITLGLDFAITIIGTLVGLMFNLFDEKVK